ncbi:hypothetical protein INT47_001950 [Mucor saturninus]|uniref:Uncharacterized protein n=1 Tax=Mucor saturninus TaxID=64648 RepID=A0A8H7RGG8_9FUNG|nr:hypothetical protein INT47_001950 [Mucor saturninus]
MIHIVRQCDRNITRLKSIETKLHASNQNMRFSQLDMMEIVSICVELNNCLNTLAERNANLRQGWILYSEKIDSMLTRFQESRCAYWLKYTLFGIAEGWVFLNTILDNTPLSILCGFLGVQLAMFCTSYEKFSVELIMSKLEERIAGTCLELSDYNNRIHSIKLYSERYQRSADSNVLRSFCSGARVNVQTVKMINETTEMQVKLQELMNESRRNAVNINRIIISEGVDNFLALSGILR